MKRILDKFFYPRSIAIIGASANPAKAGRSVWQNLREGFSGNVYPVNPKYRELDGQTCYPRLRNLPEPPDLVVIVTPAATVPDLIRDCHRKKVECALILSAGFKEAGEEGEQHFRSIQALGKELQVRIIGPNCLGLLTPSIGLNATFATAMPPTGRVAFISQSGALGAAVLDWAVDKNVGFSHFVSVGSMADIGFDALIDYFGTDNRTACILIYMESLSGARKFMSAARAFARSKPIVVLKAGASMEGARAALSHTGSLAGNDAVFDAAFRRAGVIRVQTIQQLFDCTQALATQPLPPGRRLAIVTNAGGPGIIATDALIQRGGALAVLSPESVTEQGKTLPTVLHKNNPVDIPADGTPDQYRSALVTCLRDPNVDGVLAILTAQSLTDPDEIARIVVQASGTVPGKPVYASWMGQRSVRTARETLEQGRIPWYPFPERAVTIFMHMVHYRENLDLLYETPADLPIEFEDIRRDEAAGILAKARVDGRTQLNASESKQLLASYGIPVNTGRPARTEAEAVQIAGELGFPVVLKIESPDIWRKSDVHGVRLGINNEEGVRHVYRFLMQNVATLRPDARLVGVTVERMVESSHELIIGTSRDPVFGPVILFGHGGITTEVWQDRAIGLPPLNRALADQIIRGTRIAQLLKGYRNLPAVSFDHLQDVLVRFSYLVMDFPDIREFDINPFAVNRNGGLALDATATLEPRPYEARERYEHLCIMPYPTQWIKTVTMRDGENVLLRPIRPEDEPMEAGLVQQSSKESLYFRFFGYMPGIDHKMLSRFTHIDYDREMAIVAIRETNNGLQMIGVVRIVGDGWRESAEYAILVADAWQGQGLGSLLTDFILKIAREQGYRNITASFLKNNGAMRRLFKRKGFKIRAGADEADEAEKELI